MGGIDFLEVMRLNWSIYSIIFSHLSTFIYNFTSTFINILVWKKMNHILNPVKMLIPTVNEGYILSLIYPFTDLDCFSSDKFSTSLHASPSSRPSAPSGSPTSKPPIAPAAGMREVRRGGYPTWHLKMDPWKRRFSIRNHHFWDLCLVLRGCMG